MKSESLAARADAPRLEAQARLDAHLELMRCHTLVNVHDREERVATLLQSYRDDEAGELRKNRAHATAWGLVAAVTLTLALTLTLSNTLKVTGLVVFVAAMVLLAFNGFRWLIGGSSDAWFEAIADYRAGPKELTAAQYQNLKRALENQPVTGLNKIVSDWLAATDEGRLSQAEYELVYEAFRLHDEVTASGQRARGIQALRESMSPALH